MSLSTTSTATFVLTKYSRSYPTSVPQSPDAEWQHFTNPILRLVLDIRKSATGSLESYRVRILWSLSSGMDSTNLDQREVVFEDLDLLTFSATPSWKSQNPAVQGLPLKAVYRDLVVGIRYSHPPLPPVGTTAVYRRFQMSFQTATDASKFIDAIRLVCPCKANPAPAAARTQPMPLPTIGIPPALPPAPVTDRSQFVLPRVSSTFQVGAIVTALDGRPASSNLAASRPSTANTAPAQNTPMHDVSHTTATDIASRPDLAPVAELPPAVTAFIQPPSRSSNIETPKAASVSGLYTQAADNMLRSTTSYATRGPHSHAPAGADLDSTINLAIPYSASPESTSMGPRPLPSLTTDMASSPAISTIQAAREREAYFMALLQETTILYNLPRAQLECLIAQIVHEEGFERLLQTLDSMWMLKTIL